MIDDVWVRTFVLIGLSQASGVQVVKRSYNKASSCCQNAEPLGELVGVLLCGGWCCKAHQQDGDCFCQRTCHRCATFIFAKGCSLFRFFSRKLAVRRAGVREAFDVAYGTLSFNRAEYRKYLSASQTWPSCCYVVAACKYCVCHLGFGLAARVILQFCLSTRAPQECGGRGRQ